MISSIHGQIIKVGTDHFIIDIGGIGFKVNITQQSRLKFTTDDKIFLHTYLVVREEVLALYGFESEDEREIFVLLIGVSGVGPRTALSLLSSLSVDVIRRAVISEQPNMFNKVPGVGNKTAQKIVLYLQGKVVQDASAMEAMRYMDVDTEVQEALVSLGYSVIEAQAAIQSFSKDAPKDLESRLKLALQYFSI
jgi:Holliday junction DNA helicase RuvA